MKTKLPKKPYPVPYNLTNDPVPASDGSLGVEIDFAKAFGGDMVERIREQKLLQQRTEVMAAAVQNEPVPPMNHIRGAEHHWLEKKDCDGHSAGFIVLQWNPGAKRWSHSGCVGTGMYVDTKYWTYKAQCPIPEF